MPGGGGGETTSTVTQSNLPEYAQPYFESLMNRTQAESQRPYQTYPGQRLAGMSGDTATGLDMSRQFANSSTGLGGAMNLTQQAGNVGAGVTNYNAAKINNSYNGPVGGAYQAGNFTADQVQGGTFGQAQADQYMSPYMNDVINQSKDAAIQNTREEDQYRASNAAAAGAFGGSRAAVQNQMSYNALQKNLSNIDVTGRQSAFENAQQQYERDRQAGLTAQQANQNANLSAKQMAEQSRQYGFGANQDAYQKAAELGLNAQQLSEQFRQSGQQLRLQGGELMNQSAQTRGGLGQLNDQMMTSRLQAMLGSGQTQEEYRQKQLDMGYNDFVNQRDSNRQNLQFLSSILRGVPISANSDTQTTTPTNPLAGLAGSATGLSALYGLGKTS